MNLLEPCPPRPSGRHNGLPVAVIGGGITGLTAAWHLRQQGVSVAVFERGATPGGVVRSVRDGDWLLEAGPNTLFESSPEITSFLDGLGLKSRRQEASPAARRRYVVRNGALVALPDSALKFFTSPLLSVRAKLAVLREPFRRRGRMGGDGPARRGLQRLDPARRGDREAPLGRWRRCLAPARP